MSTFRGEPQRSLINDKVLQRFPKQTGEACGRYPLYSNHLHLPAAQWCSWTYRSPDSDAASWFPPNNAYRCTYISRQIDVKALYRLWVTQAEKDVMSQVLHSC
ncbi:hypothetical protein ACNJ7E_12965 [Rhodococcus sp. NM-2]|uniref:hypothetical protein n=1 Tax=Rhodococcus sp. NM-2 TaxID=3401174 RepID=UPI003AAB0AFB